MKLSYDEIQYILTKCKRCKKHFLTNFKKLENVVLNNQQLVKSDPYEIINSYDDSIYMGSFAMYKCSVGNNISCIPANAFKNCINLAIAEIPLHIEKINDSCFEKCIRLVSCDILCNNKNLEICEKAFKDCILLPNIQLSSSYNIEIGDKSFMKCFQLSSISIDSKSICYGRKAFFFDSLLESVNYANGSVSCKYIQDECFSNCCNLTSSNIVNSVEYIGNRAFERCIGLTDLTFGPNVKYIGSEAFIACSSLSSISIPDSIEYIGDSAFAGCNLQEVKCSKKIFNKYKNVFRKYKYYVK